MKKKIDGLEKPTRVCKCSICKRYRRWEKLTKKYSFTVSDREFIEKIFLDLNMTEFNYEVDEAILDGSWPTAAEALTRSLEKAKDIQKRRENGEHI